MHRLGRCVADSSSATPTNLINKRLNTDSESVFKPVSISMKTSIISTIPKDKLVEIFNKCHNRSEVLKELGVKPQSGNLVALRNRIKQDQICCDHFVIKHASPFCKKTTDEVLCINSKTNRSVLLPRILLFEKYECKHCGIYEWRGKRIVLQIDHINGDNTDNRLENIRLLCPNCHSQTDTYAGKGKKYYTFKKIKDIEFEKYKLEERERAYMIKKEQILNSNIDFSKKGWIIELSKQFNITPQAMRRWVVKNMADFYKDKCFKHKNSNGVIL